MIYYIDCDSTMKNNKKISKYGEYIKRGVDGDQTSPVDELQERFDLDRGIHDVRNQSGLPVSLDQ
ncbi:hypothetical protein [Alistipes sp. An54]|uniref:hypothetical protein n=1 Tax=Alistipes sp. An54 TaxID=1965645 RepID=UPI001F15655C|nr:hypothetical protein [Alistipes sp. An54]